MKIRNDDTREVEQALRAYFPTATAIECYQYNIAAIRARVVDSGFQGQSRVKRSERGEGALRTLPDRIRDDVTMLLLLTPEEAAEPSLANLEFEEPSPALL